MSGRIEDDERDVLDVGELNERRATYGMPPLATTRDELAANIDTELVEATRLISQECVTVYAATRHIEDCVMEATADSVARIQPSDRSETPLYLRITHTVRIEVCTDPPEYETLH